MKAFGALLLVGSVLATVPISSVKRVSNARVSPDRFIVELDSVSAIPGKRAAISPHDVFFDHLRKRAINFRVNQKFNHPDLFVGASVSLDTTSDFAQLAAIPGVKAVRPVILIPGPKPVSKKPVQAGQPVDALSTHVMTGVDKLHAQGVFGKGVKVGILDTGIDHTHPNLKPNFAGGFDFVGDDYTGANTPVPDNDPLDQCNGHGTHVSGIIAATGTNEFNITGVAPQASLNMYRVFGCDGSVTDDILVQALLRGVDDGMDILTLSLGGADGWTEGTSSVVASRIARSGKTVTIAAGNDGSFGSWYTSGPGNGIDVISVASVENTEIASRAANVEGVAHDAIPYFTLSPLPVAGSLPIFATSTDTTIPNDACDPLPDSTPDLSNFVVIVRRGTCTFVQKLQNVADKGGKQVLIYNNQAGFTAIAVGDFVAALISADDGQFLVDQFVAKSPIKLSFPQTGGSVTVQSPTGGLVSTFSSFGPSNDHFFKPAVAAPGGNILSTFPIPLGTFAILSGTSMATPFTAGSAALILSVKGKNAAVHRGIRDRLETTSAPITQAVNETSPFQTVTQQGAGLVNVFQAIRSTTVVSPGELIVNDTANAKPIQRFTIQNNGRNTVTYSLTHVPAGTAQTIQPGTPFPALGPVPQTNDAATVRLSASKVTVRPGQSTTITATITPPRGVDQSLIPVFSGFINIQGGGEINHVTYLGTAAALKNAKVIDDTDLFFGVPLPLILDSQGNPQSEDTTYTFKNGDFPTALFRLAFGSPVVRADLVKKDIKFTPTIQRRGLRGLLSWFWPLKDLKPSGTFARVPIVGPLFEFDWITRNAEGQDQTDNSFNVIAFDTPSFANGTTIPNGDYRVLIRALKVTGNPSREEDYESFLSPGITIAA